MVQIVPAILATSEEEYKRKLTQVQSSPFLAGGWVQLDLMDGKFVQNQSIGIDVIKNYPFGNLKVEAHLMVESLGEWIDKLLKLRIQRIVFPVENESQLDQSIDYVKDHQVEVGLSVNPETPIGTTKPFMGKIDTVLVMSVNPGFGGQEFIRSSIDKVREIRKNGGSIRIGVDGGINEVVVKELVGAGADYLVIGSHLLRGDIDANLETIWEAIQK